MVRIGDEADSFPWLRAEKQRSLDSVAGNNREMRLVIGGLVEKMEF